MYVEYYLTRLAGAMKTVSLKISEQLDRRLRAAARSRRVSVSRLIRELIERGLPSRDDSADMAYDLMVDGVGVFSSGVPDLATNPRYLEGLGE